jgi:hypothetical protein
MPLSTSDFTGDGIRLQNRRYGDTRQSRIKTSEIVTSFRLEVEFFLQCVSLSNGITLKWRMRCNLSFMKWKLL